MTVPQTPPAQAPDTLLFRGQDLARVRQRLAAGDASLRPALEALLRVAEISRQAGPYSVMEKHHEPPSHDKHDYLSLATYYWPDPDIPGGKPYLSRDGQRNPECDEYDQPILRGMCEAVRALALGYVFTGRDDYARHAGSLLRIWFLEDATRMNPHLRYAQFVPGVCEGRMYGIIDVSTRFPALLDSVAILQGSLGWDAQDQAGLVTWMEQFLDWLLTSDFGRQVADCDNNHSIYYDILVARVAMFVGRDDIARQLLRTAPQRRFCQIEPDGRMPRELGRTRALSSTVMSLSGLLDLAALGDHYQLDLWNAQADCSGGDRGIRRAVDWLLPYLRRPVRFPYPQVTPFDYAVLVPVLRRAALAYHEPAYEDAIEHLADVDAPSDLTQLLYPKP